MIVALGGFMATGKSTVGPLLADRLNVPFVDLDQKVNEHCVDVHQRSISELIQSGKEDLFRASERSVVHDWMLQMSDVVVALGGGTLHNRDLGPLIEQSTMLFVLSAPWSVLQSRIEASDRPLKVHAERLYLERAAGYKIGTVVDVSEDTPATLASLIARQVVKQKGKGREQS